MAAWFYLVLAFKGWMFVDAMRRRAPALWFLVLLAPFGSVIYFVAVKLPDFRIRPAPLPESDSIAEPDIEGLRITAQESPSFDNRVALGQGLLEGNQPAEAQDAFSAALATHPHDNQALLGFAQACLALGDAKQAMEPLRQIVDRRLSYQDYEAAWTLVQALLAQDESHEAARLAQLIAHNSQRYEHRLELAQVQTTAAMHQEARSTLQSLVDELLSDSNVEPQRRTTLIKLARTLLRNLSV